MIIIIIIIIMIIMIIMIIIIIIVIIIIIIIIKLIIIIIIILIIIIKLIALTIVSCGFHLENEDIRVDVGLCLGAAFFPAHLCPCGAVVEINGLHDLYIVLIRPRQIFETCFN